MNVSYWFGLYNKLLEGKLDWRCDFYILGMWDIKVVNLLLIYVFLTLASISI